MPLRASSPARSENEFDIGDDLLGQKIDADGGPEDDGERILHGAHTVRQIGHENLDMLHNSDDSDDSDEAVIAQQLAASNRKASNLKGRTVKKGGGFQAMGLNANLLKAITRKGFSVPTPIQRKTIPLLLSDKDVVGMARTGSGKTAAFVIPMIEKLKLHSSQVGARALILSPSRELALQTLYVVKELGKGTDLRSILLVGGDSLEEQFASMSSNPDIIIATPGRFVHLQVEMKLDLSSIRYVVFDEADRLFEMGFAAQLTEILHSLPATRQTLLFSATLPKSLVEFARAGLQDPVLIRLDADSKISPDLQSSFFTVKSSEKEGALLHILQDIINVPTNSQLLSSAVSRETEDRVPKKRKRHGTESTNHKEVSNPYSTIVFAATKHHVEYLSHLLKLAGYAVSHVYGSLDQTARKLQVQAFRNGQTNVLVVTDVAARGIDIPVLANVINYDFPSQPKIYVHRVGRTARAGQKGCSYSIVNDADSPYLLDLQLFLGRRLAVGRAKSEDVSLAEDVVVGSLRRDSLQACCEWVGTNLESDADLAALRSVAAKGNKLYQRTRNSASTESAKRAKGVVASDQWSELHPLFNDEASNMEAEREKMLARVSGFRPQESVFEFGARRGGRKGNEEAIGAVQKMRSGIEKKRQKARAEEAQKPVAGDIDDEDENNGENTISEFDGIMDEASASELEITFTGNNKPERGPKKAGKDVQSFRDAENFMSYTPSNYNFHEDQAYGVHSGTNANFTEAARGATMDLAGDETGKNFGEARSVMRWDKRHKKYVNRANDEDGSKGKRLVRGESGAKIAASFRSGRYDAWRKANKITKTPRVGETEAAGNAPGSVPGHRFRHKSVKVPKAADKFRDDYEKKKKKFRETKEKERDSGVHGKRELRSVDDIRKQRSVKEKRREKNARPSKKVKR